MPESSLGQLAPCVQSFSEGVNYTTSETAASTKIKMDHERWRYEHLVSKLDASYKVAEETCSRNVQQAKDDHLKTVAYARVYQIHSFDKYDPFKDDPIDDKSKRRKRKRKSKRRENTFLTLPNVEKDEPRTLINSPISRQKNTLTYAALNARSFPQIATRESEDIETDNKSMNTSHFNALVLWKNAAKKLFEKSSPTSDHYSKEQLHSKRTVVKHERPQRKNLLPGECKTQAELKRFMEQEAMQVMQEMTTQRQQKDDNIRKMVEKAQFPDLIRRDKTFSAIVRDFQTYKEEKAQRKHRKMIEYITRHFNSSD